MMRHANHHGFPILTFIDTPGAYAGLTAEQLGQVGKQPHTRMIRVFCLSNYRQDVTTGREKP